MSAEYWAAAFTVLWTGIVTSVSPCPLATNIAALTYISKHSGRGRLAVLAHGGLYAFGRALAYAAIGFLLVKSVLAAPSSSFFLQKYGNQFLSPLLVLAGMYMLGLFGRGFGGLDLFDLTKLKAGADGASSLVMGLLFALAFCPVAAALYFGVVIPLSAARSSPVVLPLLYGLGTALPVIAAAVALDLGLKSTRALIGLAAGFEKHAKPATGWVFIACGLYLGCRYIFGLF